MMIGLIGSAFVLPLLNFATDFRSAALAMVPMWIVFSMIVTPSLAYMAEVASAAGFEAYGVVYGVYNMAWAVGLMIAPALGGFVLERVGLDGAHGRLEPAPAGDERGSCPVEVADRGPTCSMC